MLIGNNMSEGRPCSPSRAIKPSLGLFPPNANNFESSLRNNNAGDDIKLNEMFKQNNSLLTIDGKVNVTFF